MGVQDWIGGRCRSRRVDGKCRVSTGGLPDILRSGKRNIEQNDEQTLGLLPATWCEVGVMRLARSRWFAPCSTRLIDPPFDILPGSRAYDRMAQRIVSLPCRKGPGSPECRVVF